MRIKATNGREYRIEMITQSVGYSQMLAATLPYNVRHFDNVIVATTTYDTETHRVCAKDGATTFSTDAFHRNGARFDKGFARNEALKQLKFREFVLFLDCDILLPESFRDWLSKVVLDIDILYGADRIYVTKPVHVDLMREGRLSGPFHPGEWGLGHFQLFHMDSKYLQGKEVICDSNPTEEEPFGMDDYLFREQFGRGHMLVDGWWNWDPTAQIRLVLPCYHLGEAGSAARFWSAEKKTPDPITSS